MEYFTGFFHKSGFFRFFCYICIDIELLFANP